MQDILYGLIFSIIILFVYRMGVSDGARNNVKSPIKVVKDVVSDVVNHKEIKKKKEVEDKFANQMSVMMNFDPYAPPKEDEK
jgi:hypothetical protein